MTVFNIFLALLTTNFLMGLALILLSMAVTKTKKQYETIESFLKHIHFGVHDTKVLVNAMAEAMRSNDQNIYDTLKAMNKEANKDAGAIKRRQNWSKKREKKDLRQETK